MNARLCALVGLSVFLGGSGCVVYLYDPYDPPPRRMVVENPAPLVVTEDDEVHYVVYREYFGYSDEVIATFPYYRRYYGLSYDDIYFIGYVGCYGHIGFDACFRNYYYGCGRSYDQLVIAYNVPRATFFCGGAVGVGAYPAVYARTYGAYNGNNLATISIQNHEYTALVQMKVGVEYQGHAPGAFFAQVNANGGNPGRVIVANREMCGRGGVTATGGRVNVVAQRAWTMPPAQRQAWHSQQNTAVARHSEPFKSANRDQVTRVQSQQHPARPGEPPRYGHPGQEHAQGRPPSQPHPHPQGEEKHEK